MDLIGFLEAVGDSSESEDETHAPPLRRLRDRSNPFEEYSDREFRLHYRFQKETVRELSNLLSDRLKRPTKRNSPISAEMQVLIALQFMGSGSLQRVDSAVHGVHQSSVCRIVHRVMRSIAELRPRFICFPEQQELHTISEAFYNKGGRWKLPGVVGAVDGTHVPILGPGGDHGEIYRNRKGRFSVNVQILSDDKCVIRDIVASWPGSTHDSRIFNESTLKARLDNLPHRYHILGDRGYPLSSQVLTPFQPAKSRPQERYNFVQSSLRMVVERLNGIFKRRMLCLAHQLNFSPEKCAVVIVAAAVLHNLAMARGDEEDFDQSDLDEEGNDMEGNGHDANDWNTQGAAKRNAIVAQNFT